MCACALSRSPALGCKPGKDGYRKRANYERVSRDVFQAGYKSCFRGSIFVWEEREIFKGLPWGHWRLGFFFHQLKKRCFNDFFSFCPSQMRLNDKIVVLD